MGGHQVWGSGTQIGKYGVFRRTGIGFRFQMLLLFPETHQGAAKFALQKQFARVHLSVDT